MVDVEGGTAMTDSNKVIAYGLALGLIVVMLTGFFS